MWWCLWCRSNAWPSFIQRCNRCVAAADDQNGTIISWRRMAKSRLRHFRNSFVRCSGSSIVNHWLFLVREKQKSLSNWQTKRERFPPITSHTTCNGDHSWNAFIYYIINEIKISAARRHSHCTMWCCVMAHGYANNMHGQNEVRSSICLSKTIRSATDSHLVFSLHIPPVRIVEKRFDIGAIAMARRQIAAKRKIIITRYI